MSVLNTKTRFVVVFTILACLTLSLANCAKSGNKADKPDVEKEDTRPLRQRYSTAPQNWPKANWYQGVKQTELAVFISNPKPASEEMLVLGKALFFDNRLGNRNNSCASCHVPANYWTDKAIVAAGGGNRNSPNIQNSWYLNGNLMLDGRAATSAQQITLAIESPHEMAGKVSDLPKRLKAIVGYKPMFVAAYGNEDITEEKILNAIAAFSNSIESGKTAFDDFVEGDYAALSDEQIEGMHLFRTKAGCINCHNGPFFTDLEYHNLGYSLDFDGQYDYGRANFTDKAIDRGKFRTPGLRNVSYTAPYLHNGTVASLDEMVDLLIDSLPQLQGQKIAGTLSPHIKKLNLSYDERNALLAFLGSLNSSRPGVQPPVLPQ
ncbi:hypothetical protein BCY91_02300 [Pelobium manganitolerans]|uniref:Cytochrome c domain-containing protein n=2 Tax=Pelobium manganitolerans TaxID=1842495 RepID=A0A419S776_9SPHI|nr:hypothetical protein BCY91_02300 [Pelobium manganitolerans]